MGYVKKLYTKGIKFPKICCPQHAGRARQTPQQLDLFGLDSFMFHEGRFKYVVQEKKDGSPRES